MFIAKTNFSLSESQILSYFKSLSGKAILDRSGNYFSHLGSPDYDRTQFNHFSAKKRAILMFMKMTR